MTEDARDAAALVHDGTPTPEEYAALRAHAGWNAVDPSAVARGLGASLASFVARDETGALIAMGRLVGDGGVYFYLQDVVVREEQRGRGLGEEITRRLLARAEELGGPGSFIGLMAAEGAAGFYRRFGFAERLPGRPGMWRSI
jgi:ribosomal protein S18 acetylase RimI-like enzyme